MITLASVPQSQIAHVPRVRGFWQVGFAPDRLPDGGATAQLDWTMTRCCC